jgi:putative colanic acid biosynthesis UDP-glucose lipid carrier transferase
MDRTIMKIYPKGMAAGPSTAQPWHWYMIKCALDPMVGIIVFMAVSWAFGQQIEGVDLGVLVGMIFLMGASTIPFRVFNVRVVVAVLRAWSAVAMGVGVFWLGIEVIGSKAGLDPKVTLTWLLLAPAAMLLLHRLTPYIVPRLWKFYPRRKVVVVGVNSVAVRVAQSFAERGGEGQQFVGFFDDRNPERTDKFTHSPVLGSIADVSNYVKQHGVDSIYISLPMATQPRVVSLLNSLADTTASVHFLPDVFVADMIQGQVTSVAGLPVVSVCETPFNGAAGALKRIFDLALILSALPVLVPLMMVTAATVRLTSPGPVLFVQRRYGLDGKPINIYKFRSMSTLEDGEKSYKQVTRDDPRVTPIGKFLRATSLDELPQLFNVLSGSMSLVGPRPHALAVNEQYRRLIPGYMVRHKVKPGISGWAQVNGCRGGDDLESMRKRTEYDLEYLRNWSLALDAVIVLKTLKILIMGDKRAY